MDTSFVQGVIPPILTPVDEHERVQEEGLRRVIRHVMQGGVHGILVLGTSGEFYGLDPAEQSRALDITIHQVQQHIPVYMGVGAITTRECVNLARMAESHGAQAITLLPPMFLTPSEDELYRHFATVADATSLPVLLYNNPDRVRNNISANLLERVAQIPNIVGIKDSSGDFTLTSEYIRRTRDAGFRVLAGRDVMILASLTYGAVGCVASTANIVPELVVEIYDRYMAGDVLGALEAQFRLAPLRMAFNRGTFPTAIKDAANLIGLEVGHPIAPATSCKQADIEALRQILIDLGAVKERVPEQ